MSKGGARPGAGRPKGGKNEKTMQWEKFSEWFLSEGLSRLETEMGTLQGKDYVFVVKDLLEYFKPKLARQENTTEIKGLNGVIVYLPTSPDQQKQQLLNGFKPTVKTVDTSSKTGASVEEYSL